MNTTKEKGAKVLFGLLVIFIMIIPLSSCVYDKEFAYLNDQIVSLNRRVTKLQESTDTKIGKDMESIHSTQGQMRIEVDQLKEKMSGLSGRVEDSEHILKRTVERDLGEQNTLQGSVVALSQKVTELETMVRHQYRYLGLEPSTIQEPQKKEESSRGQGALAPEQAVVKATEESKELELYEQSLTFFRQNKYEESIAGFQDFLKKYPKSDRADNAQFWIGESHIGLKQYEQAILAYQKVIKGYPKGNKVPAALLRQALAFLEINDKTSTKLLLKKVIKEYPNSNEAKIAQTKLDTLK